MGRASRICSSPSAPRWDGRRETIAQQRTETYRIMSRVGLRLLLIDDLHDIRGGSGLASMLVQLREIGSIVGVSLGCFATREIAYALRQDDQLANRFEVMTLPRWQIEDPDYWRLLHTFGRRLPLRHASNLADPELAADILARANGLIGSITRLLRQAAVEAVRTGHERIDRAMLDRVRTSNSHFDFRRFEGLGVKLHQEGGWTITAGVVVAWRRRA